MRDRLAPMQTTFNGDEIERMLAPVAELAIAAGARILEIAAAGLATRSKADRSPVTAADEAAEEILVAGLNRHFPGIPVIAEEAASRDGTAKPGATYFLVDPIDGTRELVADRGEYTVNIGLIVDRAPRLGVIYAPRLDTLYVAAGGNAMRAALAPGAHFDASRTERIRVRPRPAQLVALVSRSHPDPASDAYLASLPIERRIPLGSSLKFGRLAEGAADIYVRLGTVNEWDVAAGHALLLAAGGSMNAADGNPVSYGLQPTGFAVDGFVAWGGPPV
jgi:3'(2'), 5'-bisphosphate nucleotidase